MPIEGLTCRDLSFIAHRKIYTPKPPYSAQLYKGIVEIMSREHVIERPGEITEPLWDLLQLCRSYLPVDRPSMVAVEEFLVQM